MGIVGEAIEKVAGEELGTSIRSALTSPESMLSDTTAGKWVYDTVGKYLDRVKLESASTYANDVNLYKNQGINLTPKDHEQLMSVARSSAERRNETLHFGLNRNKLTQAVAMAAKQKNIAHATEVGDYASMKLREETPKTFKSPITGQLTNWRQEAGIKGKSPYLAPTKGEQQVHSVMSYGFLSHVGIAHLPQNLNVALTLGWKNWAKAWDEVNYLGRTPQASHYLGAMYDDTLQGWKLINQGKDTWVNKFFNAPGLSLERKKYLEHAAAAGKWAAIDAADDFAQNQSKAAFERLKFLRLDPAAILRQGGKLTQDDIEQAALASAAENMLIAGNIPGKTPLFWQRDATRRFMYLYKSFAFREGKLIKDAVARNLRSGIGPAISTLATLGVVFPLAGHIIGDLENVATWHRKPGGDSNNPLNPENFEDRSTMLHPSKVWGMSGNEYFDTYIDDLSHMAAFGIWYSMFRAVARHRMTDYTAGPLVSIIADSLNAAYYGVQGKPKYAVKAAIRRVPLVGAPIASNLDDIIDAAKGMIP